VRPTMFALSASSILESASELEVDGNEFKIKISPLSMGVCYSSIYEKLKNIKHTHKNI